MTTICPQCGSDRVSERNIGRTAGGIAGGVAGALSGAGTGAHWFCCTSRGDCDGSCYWRFIGEICCRCYGRSRYGSIA
jgi:hypothetical protein